MGHITLTDITKSYGSIDVLRSINLEINDGELVVFVGPSGCGKSTLLRTIAGLETPTGGDMFIDGRKVNDVSAADRGLAMVFQSYALYPHMSVRQNLAFGLENTKMPKAEIQSRIIEAARMLNIDSYLDRRPGQLSGGQRQRVAIGRAIVRRPVAFLLDEPLSNLDAELRGTTRAELAALHKRLATTMIYVTHDQVEAMTLADRIVVLRAGKIEQVGTPLELYNSPANRFVAGFIGSPHMNFLEGTVAGVEGDSARIRLPNHHLVTVPRQNMPLVINSAVTLGVRPHHITPANQGDHTIPATVRLVEGLGAETILHTTVAGQNIVTVLPGQHHLQTGSDIHLSLANAPVHMFNEKGLRLENAV